MGLQWDAPKITTLLQTTLGNGLALLESCHTVSSSVKTSHSSSHTYRVPIAKCFVYMLTIIKEMVAQVKL